MSKELTIQKSLAPVVDQALALTIKTADDMPPAVELLSKLNQFNDRIVEEREKVTKPLNEALKAERARWKPMETANQSAIDHIRNEMSAYQTAETKRQKAQEAKIAADLASGKIKKIETAVKKIEAVKTPDKEVATTAGLVQFRETATLKILDINLIPREYMIVNEKEVLASLKAGKVVPGAEIELVQVPVNYR